MFVDHIFTLLLVPFTSRLVYYSKLCAVSLWRKFEHRQITVFEGKCRQFRIFINVQSLTVPRIMDQFRQKDAKRSVKMWSKNFCKSFLRNILLYWAVRNSISTHACYMYLGWFFFGWQCIYILWRLNAFELMESFSILPSLGYIYI